MAIGTFDDTLAGVDARTIVVNGKKYHAITKNRCTTCSAEERFLYIVQKVGNDQVSLNCPFCDTTETISVGMLNK